MIFFIHIQVDEDHSTLKEIQILEVGQITNYIGPKRQEKKKTRLSEQLSVSI